jgi:outer membrane protein assembly factor BamA
LAFRFSISDSWGEARRFSYLGGNESHLGYHVAGNDLFTLMRGYPSGFFTGTGGYLFNLEYRLSLFKIENVFFVFQSIERLYMTLFTDMGNLWIEDKKINPSYSFGAELNLVVVMGEIRMTISSGIAVGKNPHRSPTIYFRLGNTSF